MRFVPPPGHRSEERVQLTDAEFLDALRERGILKKFATSPINSRVWVVTKDDTYCHSFPTFAEAIQWLREKTMPSPSEAENASGRMTQEEIEDAAALWMDLHQRTITPTGFTKVQGTEPHGKNSAWRSPTRQAAIDNHLKLQREKFGSKSDEPAILPKVQVAMRVIEAVRPANTVSNMIRSAGPAAKEATHEAALAVVREYLEGNGEAS